MSRVMIIDDELPIRRVLRRILEQAGHTVLDVPDGLQGLALWRKEPTNVVVTDIFMPEKDGIEVILEMNSFVPRPRIIAMSGGEQSGLFDLISVALLLGADRIILKPFNRRKFLETVYEVLDGQV